MRDSPSFKILDKFLNKNFECSVYDPYFKSDLMEKYIVENHMKNRVFDILPSLDDNLINKFGCVCIVQHHSKTEFRLNEIYQNSSVSFIYDCQGKIMPEKNSKTILKSFGS